MQNSENGTNDFFTSLQVLGQQLQPSFAMNFASYRYDILVWIWFLVTIGDVAKGIIKVHTYDKSKCVPGPHRVYPNTATRAPPEAPLSFRVRFTITPLANNIDDPNSASSHSVLDDRSFVVQVNRTWAPIGVDRFYQLILDNYYDCAAFFRVVPDFVVQFGIASDPSETEKWNFNVPDDPMIIQSNIRGTVSYATAGPGTRTTQLFINSVNNRNLDRMGFVPIGIIAEDAMNDVVPYIFNPADDNGIDQGDYEEYGNSWLLKEYPDVDLIVNTTLILDGIDNIQVANIDRTSQQQQSHRFYGRNYDNNDNR